MQSAQRDAKRINCGVPSLFGFPPFWVPPTTTKLYSSPTPQPRNLNGFRWIPWQIILSNLFPEIYEGDHDISWQSFFSHIFSQRKLMLKLSGVSHPSCSRARLHIGASHDVSLSKGDTWVNFMETQKTLLWSNIISWLSCIDCYRPSNWTSNHIESIDGFFRFFSLRFSKQVKFGRCLWFPHWTILRIGDRDLKPMVTAQPQAYVFFSVGRSRKL